MMMVFVEEKAMVFVPAEIIFHNGAQEINNLMDLLFAHPRDQHPGEAFIAEMLQEFDKRLLVGLAIKSEKHKKDPGEREKRLTGKYFPPQPAAAGTVEFAQEEMLPRSQSQTTLMDEHGHG
jgi:hypothetical protein